MAILPTVALLITHPEHRKSGNREKTNEKCGTRGRWKQIAQFIPFILFILSYLSVLLILLSKEKKQWLDIKVPFSDASVNGRIRKIEIYQILHILHIHSRYYDTINSRSYMVSEHIKAFSFAFSNGRQKPFTKIKDHSVHIHVIKSPACGWKTKRNEIVQLCSSRQTHAAALWYQRTARNSPISHIICLCLASISSGAFHLAAWNEGRRNGLFFPFLSQPSGRLLF
jgi:hypothetical protein